MFAHVRIRVAAMKMSGALSCQPHLRLWHRVTVKTRRRGESRRLTRLDRVKRSACSLEPFWQWAACASQTVIWWKHLCGLHGHLNGGSLWQNSSPFFFPLGNEMWLCSWLWCSSFWTRTCWLYFRTPQLYNLFEKEKKVEFIPQSPYSFSQELLIHEFSSCTYSVPTADHRIKTLPNAEYTSNV